MSLLHVGRCGQACVTWEMTGSGRVENQCCTKTFQTALLPGVVSWRRPAAHYMELETAAREETSSVTRNVRTSESH